MSTHSDPSANQPPALGAAALAGGAANLEGRIRSSTYWLLPPSVRAAGAESKQGSWLAAVVLALQEEPDPMSPVFRAATGLLKAALAEDGTIRDTAGLAFLLERYYAVVTDHVFVFRDLTMWWQCCQAFTAVAGCVRGWSSRDVGRVPVVLDWEPLWLLLTSCTSFAGHSGHSVAMTSVSNAVSDNIRSILESARSFFCPTAYRAVWLELRRLVTSSRQHLGQLLFLPASSRLFRLDVPFPAGANAAAVVAEQIETARDMVAFVLATPHWHQHDGSWLVAQADLLVGVVDGLLQSPLPEEELTALRRSVHLPELTSWLFQTVMRAMRLPIGDPSERGPSVQFTTNRIVHDSNASLLRSCAKLAAWLLPSGTAHDACSDTVEDEAPVDGGSRRSAGAVYWHHLRQLCLVTEVHATSEASRRSQAVLTFLENVSGLLLLRLGQQIDARDPLPEHAWLVAETLAKFAHLLREPALRTVYSASQTTAQLALSLTMNLLLVCPSEASLADILETALGGVNATTEANRIATGLQLFGQTLRVGLSSTVPWATDRLRGRLEPDRGLPETGARSVALLKAAVRENMAVLLQGLDGGDFVKLRAAMMPLYQVAALMSTVPVVERADVVGMPLEDLVLTFVEKLFAVLHTVGHFASGAFLSNFVEGVFEAVGPAAAKIGVGAALRRLLSMRYPDTRHYGVLVCNLCKVDGVDAVGAMLPAFLDRLVPADTDASDLTEADLKWYGRLAVQVVRYGHPEHLLPHLPAVRRAVAALRPFVVGAAVPGHARHSADLAPHSKLRGKLGGKLLQAALNCLTDPRVLRVERHEATHPVAHDRCLFLRPQQCAVRAWFPTAASAAAAFALYDDFIAPVLAAVREAALETKPLLPSEGDAVLGVPPSWRAHLLWLRYGLAGAHPLLGVHGHDGRRAGALPQTAEEWRASVDYDRPACLDRPFSSCWHVRPGTTPVSADSLAALAGRTPLQREPVWDTLALVTEAMVCRLSVDRTLRGAARLEGPATLEAALRSSPCCLRLTEESLKALRVLTKVFDVAAFGKSAVANKRIALMTPLPRASIIERKWRAVMVLETSWNKGSMAGATPRWVNRLARCMLFFSRGPHRHLRAHAQGGFTGLMSHLHTEPYLLAVLRDLAAHFADPERFSTLPDCEQTGLLHLVHGDYGRHILHEVATTLIAAPAFQKVENEQRRRPAMETLLRMSLWLTPARTKALLERLGGLIDAAPSAGRGVVLDRALTVAAYFDGYVHPTAFSADGVAIPSGTAGAAVSDPVFPPRLAEICVHEALRVTTAQRKALWLLAFSAAAATPVRRVGLVDKAVWEAGGESTGHVPPWLTPVTAALRRGFEAVRFVPSMCLTQPMVQVRETAGDEAMAARVPAAAEPVLALFRPLFAAGEEAWLEALVDSMLKTTESEQDTRSLWVCWMRAACRGGDPSEVSLRLTNVAQDLFRRADGSVGTSEHIRLHVLATNIIVACLGVQERAGAPARAALTATATLLGDCIEHIATTLTLPNDAVRMWTQALRRALPCLVDADAAHLVVRRVRDLITSLPDDDGDDAHGAQVVCRVMRFANSAVVTGSECAKVALPLLAPLLAQRLSSHGKLVRIEVAKTAVTFMSWASVLQGAVLFRPLPSTLPAPAAADEDGDDAGDSVVVLCEAFAAAIRAYDPKAEAALTPQLSPQPQPMPTPPDVTPLETPLPQDGGLTPALAATPAPEAPVDTPALSPRADALPPAETRNLVALRSGKTLCLVLKSLDPASWLPLAVELIARVADMSVEVGDSLPQQLQSAVQYVGFGLIPPPAAKDCVLFCARLLRGGPAPPTEADAVVLETHGTYRYHHGDGGPLGYGVSRRAKALLLRLMRIVLFNNHFAWLGDELQALLLVASDAAVSLMDHEYRPAREQAMLFLSVACRTMPRSALGPLVARWLTRGVPTAPAASDSNVSRVAAVSALCAVAAAFPESVPTFVPKMLCRLTRWVRPPSDKERALPAPIGVAERAEAAKIVKDTLQDWWRAHRDEWHRRHQSHFTEGQEELLKEFFMAHSYYV